MTSPTAIVMAIALVCVAFFVGAMYLCRTLPWPFHYQGKKYRRVPDGSFQDADRHVVTDPTLIEKLQAAFEEAKYGSSDKVTSWDLER